MPILEPPLHLLSSCQLGVFSVHAGGLHTTSQSVDVLPSSLHLSIIGPVFPAYSLHSTSYFRASSVASNPLSRLELVLSNLRFLLSILGLLYSNLGPGGDFSIHPGASTSLSNLGLLLTSLWSFIFFILLSIQQALFLKPFSV